jgi:hypothetical protein
MLRLAAEVLRRPSLWVVAGRQAGRLVPAGWWRRAPYLPLPSREYLRFRLLTQYGDAEHEIEPRDVLNYLRWCAVWERSRVEP